jgi:type I restriction enzyme S subunit
MSEWQEVYLNEAFDISSGLSKPANDFGSGFPFLSFKEIFNNFFVPEELSELVKSSKQERHKCSVKKGDVFLTRTSETVKELGMSSVALKDYDNATFNGFTKRLRPNGKFEIVPEYAGYYFRSYKFRREVTAMSSASTRASLNNEMLGRLKIVLPSKKEQKKIAAVLMCLDAKIENLRRQNETLERMAQTLFKHWFIDFEFPNEKGEPYRSSGGAMQPSELGEIPAGWRVGKLGDEFNILMGQSPAGSSYNEDGEGSIFFQGRTDFGFRFPQVRLFTTEPKRIAHKFDVLVSVRAPVGDINVAFEKCCIGRGLSAVSSHYKSYCLYKLKSFKKVFEVFESEGTVFGSLNKQSFNEIESVIPTVENLESFESIVSSIDKKVFTNSKQIQTLTQTRDTLLPKLMSGKLRVTE